VNDSNTYSFYGPLYNWYAVSSSNNLAPAGWHIPTDAEWATLLATAGGASVAGKLKVAGYPWSDPDSGASNAYNFNALPSGYVGYSGNWGGINIYGYWWSNVTNNATSVNVYIMSSNTATVALTPYGASDDGGFSVRCVKDAP
jgi:uncharacterized protein (TIGR02145 family)